MTLLMVVPLVLIVGYLFYQAWPILSLDFLLTNPRNGMRAGGIWSPLLGTLYLVVHLAASSPRPSACWRRSTSTIRAGQLVHARRQPGRRQSGRRAQHRARAVRPRRLRAVRRTGPVHPGRLADAGDHDPAGDHRQHQGSAGRGADGVPRGLLERRRHALADDPPHRAAQFDQRHSYRGHPAGFARGRRDRADHVHRRVFFKAIRGGRGVRLRPVRPVHGAVDAPVHDLHAGARCAQGAAYGTAVVLLGTVLLVNALAIVVRV